MSQSRLKYVRKDSKHVVMTEHPDYIHPRVLAEELTAQYGDKQFHISLRRNIYVIYINIEVAGKHLTQCSSDGDAEKNFATRGADETCSQQLEDAKLAEEVLRQARVSRSY
ncbi:hypothetical protein F5B19DRAFT_476466 [Rostrohypoxylon terebratum]|nr:hypothetical protein F5B19DRAFT_476466 [Rostrohypoxylon terebratum]